MSRTAGGVRLSRQTVFFDAPVSGSPRPKNVKRGRLNLNRAADSRLRQAALHSEHATRAFRLVRRAAAAGRAIRSRSRARRARRSRATLRRIPGARARRADPALRSHPARRCHVHHRPRPRGRHRGARLARVVAARAGAGRGQRVAPGGRGQHQRDVRRPAACRPGPHRQRDPGAAGQPGRWTDRAVPHGGPRRRPAGSGPAPGAPAPGPAPVRGPPAAAPGRGPRRRSPPSRARGPPPAATRAAAFCPRGPPAAATRAAPLRACDRPQQPAAPAAYGSPDWRQPPVAQPPLAQPPSPAQPFRPAQPADEDKALWPGVAADPPSMSHPKPWWAASPLSEVVPIYQGAAPQAPPAPPLRPQPQPQPQPQSVPQEPAWEDAVHAVEWREPAPQAPRADGGAPEPLPSVDRRPTMRMPLPAKALRIGRVPDNDVVLPDLDVSRHHAELRKSPRAAYEIVDLGSHNGTYVNGRRCPPRRFQRGRHRQHRPLDVPPGRR